MSFIFNVLCSPIRRCYIHVFLCHRCRGKNLTFTSTIDFAPSNPDDVTEISRCPSRWNLSDLIQETTKETVEIITD